MLYNLITTFDALRSLEITVKVKATMRFAKIFEAAEVCQMRLSIIAKTHSTQKRFGKEPGMFAG